jgi:hypothetical protein
MDNILVLKKDTLEQFLQLLPLHLEQVLLHGG